MAALFPFGKHKGKTIEWIFFYDPGYIWWLRNKGTQLYGEAGSRFEQLVRRASHLRIPGVCPWCKKRAITRMFCTLHCSGGLADVSFDCDECAPDGGSLSTPMKPSFYTPDVFRDYDKTGAKFLIDAIKYAYFGSKVRMTQQKMEEFFDDPANFVNF